MSLQKRLDELKRRAQEKAKPSFDLERVAFRQQLEFIKDASRLKALFCTRRAAKSYTGGIYLVHAAINNPGCNCLFVGLTRQTAHGIVWKDILRDLDQKHKLNIKFNETLLTATFPNGSVIWVTGADTDEQEMNKLLGRKYKLAFIDEASMFTINLKKMVEGVLGPAMADLKGTICLAGTASNITQGYFYDITTGKEQGWSLHSWTAHENPFCRWSEELKEIDEKRPDFKFTNLYRQWYLNEWVIDENALVYKFDEARNRALHLPVYDTPWHFVLGIDLGHSPDPSAFVVGAYHDLSKTLFIVHTEKHLGLDVTSVSEKIKELDARYNFDAKIIDGSMKMAIAEMNTRHKVNVIPADKTGKEHWINLLNSDLIQSKVKILPQGNELIEELKTLVWATDNGVIKIPRKEHPNLPNHLTDAFLYLWRHCHPYLERNDEKPQQDWEREHIKRLEIQVQKDLNPNQWDVHFEPDKDLFDLTLDDQL